MDQISEMPEDNEGPGRKSKSEKQREGYLMLVIKSSWYTVALISLLFGGTVMFMGIEGNHEEFVSYKLLEEQLHFNETLRAVS